MSKNTKEQKKIIFNDFGTLIAFTNFPFKKNIKSKNNGNHLNSTSYGTVIDKLFEESSKSDYYSNKILKPHKYFVFSRFFDVCVISPSRSNNLALHKFRRYNILDADPYLTKNHNLESLNINKHIIWGGNFTFKEDESLSSFDKELKENPLIGIIHLKFRNEFFLQEDAKKHFENYINKIISHYNKINPDKPIYFQLSTNYSEVTILIPTNKYSGIIDFSKELRHLGYFKAPFTGKKLTNLYRTYTTLGVNFNSDNIDPDDEINIAISFTIKSGADIVDDLENIVKGIKNQDNTILKYVLKKTEGKTDLILNFDKIKTSVYVTLLKKIIDHDFTSKILNIHTAVSRVDVVRDSSNVDLDSNLIDCVKNKFLFKHEKLKELKEKLEKYSIPYSVQEYILNIFNTYNNKITDPYEYFAYIDLYYYLKSYLKYIEYVIPKTADYREFIEGTEEFEATGLDNFYEISKLAFENRVFSSYYLSYEVSELNLMYSGGSVGRITSLNGLYKTLYDFVNINNKEDEDSRGCFLLATNDFKIGVQEIELNLEKKSKHINILRTNFNFLFKIDNLLPVLFAEISFLALNDYPPINRITKDSTNKILKQILKKISYSIKIKGKIDMMFYDYIFNKNLITGDFLEHIVKDFFSLHFLFNKHEKENDKNVDFCMFSFWLGGIYLTDRSVYHFDGEKEILKIKEPFFYDFILRFSMVYYLHLKIKKEELNNENKNSFIKDFAFMERFLKYHDKKFINKTIELTLDFVEQFFKQKKNKQFEKELFKFINFYKEKINNDDSKNTKKVLKKVNEFLHKLNEEEKELKSDSEETTEYIFFRETGSIGYHKKIKPTVIKESNQLIYELNFLILESKSKYIKEYGN